MYLQSRPSSCRAFLANRAPEPDVQSIVGDDQQTWAAARGGDPDAFRRLVSPHTDGLYRVSLRILGDPSLAEDAVQEALWNAYRGLERFDERARFSTWLYRVGVNAALSLRRAHRTDTDTTPITGDRELRAVCEIPDESPLPFDIAGARQLEGALAQALHRLTPLERTAFVLRHLEQRSLEEIAVALESNANACKQAIFRAVKKLRPALASWRTEP